MINYFCFCFFKVFNIKNLIFDILKIVLESYFCESLKDFYKHYKAAKWKIYQINAKIANISFIY